MSGSQSSRSSYLVDKSSNGDMLLDEYMDLKTKTYDEMLHKGFNPNDGYFYTGNIVNGLSEIIYRDESGNLSLHLIDDRFKRKSARMYMKYGIPFDASNFVEGDIKGGNPKSRSNEPRKTEWDQLTVPQLKGVLRENKLIIRGNKEDLINRLKDIDFRVPNIPLSTRTNISIKRKQINDNSSTRKKYSTKRKKNSSSSSDKEQKNKEQKKRKNVDYNAFELIIALILKYKVQNVTSMNDLINTKSNELYKEIGLDQSAYEKFVIDYKTRSPQFVNKYILNFHNKNNNHIILDEIESVKLSGKGTNKDEKSDVFFSYKNDDGEYGISIKQSKDATLSNYSVNLIFDTITKNREISNELQKIKFDFITGQGLDIKQKSDRAKIGPAFYNLETPYTEETIHSNPYWQMMRIKIKENSKQIANIIMNSVYCIKSNKTVVYEYDGDSLTQFVPKCMNDVDIIEDIGYYTKTNNMHRKAAKLFYKILVDGEIKYRCEIRHKGSWTASPQFMLYKM